jgi:hypothetical protein
MKLGAANRLLEASVKWVVPKPADLALEFKYEYALPSRNWPQRCKAIGAAYPIFEDEEDFINKVKSSEVAPLTPKMGVHNLTNERSVEDVRDLVSGYAYPRDVDRIVQGYEAGTAMPMPIIIRGKKGSWILSGNTRSNLAFILKIPVKAIWVDA